VAKDMGHAGEINYSQSAPTFQLNGQPRKMAGRFFPSNGAISLYPRHLHDPASIEDVLAHEIGHSKYHTVYKLLAKEDARRSKNPEHKALHEDDAWTPEMESMYPVGAKLRKFNMDKLAEHGGISSYTKDKWQGVKEGTVDRGHALDETHADLAMLYRQALRTAARMGPDPTKPNPNKVNMAKADLLARGIKKHWLDFHDAIDELYREHNKKQRSNFIKAYGIKR